MPPTVTRSFSLVLLLLLAALPASAVSVDAVPNPRPGGWVVDMVGVLTAEDVRALEQLGNDVQSQIGAQLAVAVVGSTDGVPHRQFATELANRWGLGDPEKDNGVLVFAALDDRAAEITLGEGSDDAAQTAIALDVMNGEMVPLFRAGDPAGAIFAGALGCARRILGATPSIGGRPAAAAVPQTAAPAAALPSYALPQDASSAPGCAGGALFFGMLALLGGGGIATIVGARRAYRRRPRRCEKCSVEMVRLEEAEDDAHLSSGEQLEERLGSVDYDVWLCLTCSRVEKLRYGAFFTSYASCPRCGARTVSSTSFTESEASESSEGSVRVEESCQHCDHRNSYTRSIPRLERRTTFSSAGSLTSSSASLYSSSSSGRSSSSSSSGGSGGGGGGHSAGSGASGRW